MELQVFFAFVAATAIMIALPGPSVLLAVAHSVSYGWKPALSTVAGETMGIAVQIAIAVIGLSSLLHVVAEAFDWLRWAGAAYLVYLGIKQWRGAGKPLEFNPATASRRNLFMQGLIITIPNPKSLIFISAFLPQFIDQNLPLSLQFAVIVPTFLVITFTVTSVWAVAAGNVSIFLKSRRAFQWVFRMAGGLMIIAGLGLVLARRGN